ncbi:MAG TPA: protein kinase [Bacteroidales bacterium]|nr:protein kinase [Bacteroidales bacterium]
MEKIIRGYVLQKELYSNPLFKVYEAEHSILKGQTLRLTLLNPEYMQQQELKSEFSSSSFKLSFAEHPYIIRNSDMIEENGHFAILSENIPLIPFINYIENQSHDFETIKSLIEKILEGLIYLNDKKIFHLALSAEDIYIDTMSNPRIAYYGIAGIFLKTHDAEFKKTVFEQLKVSVPEFNSNLFTINDRSEVFSCGQFLEELAKLEILKNYNQNILMVVNKATSTDPLKRYKDVKELLNDFKNIDNHSFSAESKRKFSVSSNVENEKDDYIYNTVGLNDDKKTIPNNTQAETKSVFEIIDEIKNQKADYQRPEPPKQTVQQNSASQQKQNTPPPPPKYNQPSGQSAQTNYQSRQNTSTSPIVNQQQKVNPQSVLVLGIFAVIMSFIFSFFGLVVSVIGFVKLSSNNKKIKEQKLTLKSGDKQVQSIGTFLCVLAIIISIIRFISSIVSMFN